MNFGYTFSNGEASDEATSFDLDPQQYALSTVPGFSPPEVDLSVPDEINYTVGFSVAAGPRVTLGFDMLGRRSATFHASRYRQRVREPRPGALPTATFTAQNEFSVESRTGNLNLLLGVTGGQDQPGRDVSA